MEERYCQSCGMPMGEGDAMYGTEKDGSKSADYCSYCYQKGAFTSECSMEEMIDFCVKPMVENVPGMTEAMARDILNKSFPSFKRWKQQGCHWACGQGMRKGERRQPLPFQSINKPADRKKHAKNRSL